MRFFNTEGPVHCDEHYCLPPLSRRDLDDVLMLIERKKYFLLHAPRQTGKTSCPPRSIRSSSASPISIGSPTS